MVRGLDIFLQRFAAFADQYVLIGGTAASLTMEDAGLSFRATKDLDIVLHVESLTPAFGEAIWTFVTAGGYQIRQASTGRPIFYRFQKPTDERYPMMVELFARAPDRLQPVAGSQLTPIPLDDALSSLSAILLDEDYYAFIMAGRREIEGLSCVGEDRLIPLKAIAWMDLSQRREQGAAVDAKDVRKHLNDALRLSQLLAPATRISISTKIADDMARFLGLVEARHGDRSESAAARQGHGCRVGCAHRPSVWDCIAGARRRVGTRSMFRGLSIGVASPTLIATRLLSRLGR